MKANELAGFLLCWTSLLYAKSAYSTSNVGILQEVCMGESFHAECPDGQVVIILSALYGRMHVSRCARQDDIGCVADVMEYIDAKCSGKQRCDFLTLDQGLYVLNTCPPEFTPYLEAVYNCITVISDPSLLSQCQHTGAIVLSGIAQGSIASSIVHNSRLGSGVCPWVIQADQGQHINITLVDFRSPGTDLSMATCHIYATITESSSPSPTTVCSGTEREHVVYLSSSSRIEIKFSDTLASELTSHFLLKFKVLGCGELSLNGNIINQITLHKAILYCKSTGKEQNIFCKGTSWNQLADECHESYWNVFSSDWGSQKGFWVVLAIGIAVGIVIGLGLLLCGIICIKRFKKQANNQNMESPYYKRSQFENKSVYTLRKGEAPRVEMDYATYDRTAAGSRRYMHVTSPVNRDVMFVETESIRRHESIPPVDYEQFQIPYADQEEPVHVKNSN